MWKITIVGLLIAVVLAVLLSPFASQLPDGLEKVAEDKGFISASNGKALLKSPLPDYTVPAVKHELLSVSLAGLFGTIITFGIALIIGHTLKKKALNKIAVFHTK